MSEAPRQHPLVDFLATRAGQGESANPGVAVEVLALRTHLNLRGKADDGQFLATCEKALGQSLPRVANRFSRDAHQIFWLGPDEWLLVTEQSGVESSLSEVLAGQHCSITDISGGQSMLRLTGAHARDVLAKGCTLDFHPAAFQPGHCAQTGLAKTAMLVALIDQTPTFELIIRRSFADYAGCWLDHAGQEYDIAWR